LVLADCATLLAGAIYLNWNPSLFAYRCTIHGDWPKAIGPRNDSLNREFCPQYTMSIDVPAKKAPASVWILLSKHVTEKKEEEDEFITLHVYDAGKPGRVYYAENALMRGTYINNPHYLTRMDVGAGVSTYKIVVSQYEKMHDLSFTLNIYSTAKCVLLPIPHSYTHQQRLPGSWRGHSAGGSPNHPSSYLLNPQFGVVVPGPTNLLFKLEGPKEYSVNITVFFVHSAASDEPMRITSLSSRSGDIFQEPVSDSGPFRKGFCYTELSGEEMAKRSPSFPCCLTVIVSTFLPQQEGPFVLTVGSTACDVRVVEL